VPSSGTIRLVLGSGYTGSGGDPTYAVGTGGNLAMALQFDCDAPVGSNATVAYEVSGSDAGSRVGTANGEPMFNPYKFVAGRFINSAPEGTANASLTRWDSDAALAAWAAFGGYYRSDYFRVFPPVGQRPVRTLARTELVTRPDRDDETPSSLSVHFPCWGLYRRPGSGEAWTKVGAGVETADSATIYIGEWLTSNGEIVFHTRVGTADGGATWPAEFDTIVGDYGPAEAQANLRIETGNWSPFGGQINHYLSGWDMVPNTDGIWGGVLYDFMDDAEAILARVSPGPNAYSASPVTVASAVRTGSDDGSRPYPWIWRRRDGLWTVGWFANDAYREFTSDDVTGSAWTETTPATPQTWTAGAGNYAVTNHCRGISGVEAVAGYHFDDAQFTTMVRTGPEAAWDGPHLIAASQTAAAPYLIELPDGTWEAGWLLSGTWTRYTAPSPAGPWSAV